MTHALYVYIPMTALLCVLIKFTGLLTSGCCHLPHCVGTKEVCLYMYMNVQFFAMYEGKQILILYLSCFSKPKDFPYSSQSNDASKTSLFGLIYFIMPLILIISMSSTN